MRSRSYVVLKSEDLRTIAEHVIGKIERERERLKNAEVEDAISKRINSRWRKFWNRPVPPAKEIRAQLESKREEFGLPYFWDIDGVGREEEALARKLMNAAKFSNHVNVDAEDLNSLKYWIYDVNKLVDSILSKG